MSMHKKHDKLKSWFSIAIICMVCCHSINNKCLITSPFYILRVTTSRVFASVWPLGIPTSGLLSQLGPLRCITLMVWPLPMTIWLHANLITLNLYNSFTFRTTTVCSFWTFNFWGTWCNNIQEQILTLYSAHVSIACCCPAVKHFLSKQIWWRGKS